MGKFFRNPDLVWRDEPEERDAIITALDSGDEAAIDRGWVIIVEGGHMHELNLIAGEIWLLCDGELDEMGIAKKLALAYDAPAEEIVNDVRAFVEAYIKR
ncbi:PqqD family peptide modification chaperone, partial [bacterium]